MGPNGLDELMTDAVERIQRSEGVLKNRANSAPTEPSKLVLGILVDPFTCEADLTARDPPRRIQQADDGRTRQGFTSAGFTDDAQNLARGDRQTDAIKCSQEAAACGELNDQIVDFKEIHHHHRKRGLSASRSQSPSRLILKAMMISMAPGNTVIHHSPENK